MFNRYFRNPILGIMICSFTSLGSPAKDRLRSIDSFENFASNLETFEREKLRNMSKNVSQRQKAIEKSYEDEKATSRNNQIEILQKTIAIYRKSLEEAPSNLGTLNLAIALNNLGTLYKEAKNTELASKSFSEAYDNIKSLDTSANFSETSSISHKTLFLKSILEDNLDRKNESNQSLMQLARKADTHLYGVLALMTLGDQDYTAGRFQNASRHYMAAFERVGGLKREEAFSLAPKIKYRLGWSSFRAGQYEIAADAFMDLNTNLGSGQSALNVELVKLDTVYVVSESLIARNSAELERKILTQKNSMTPEISVRFLKRLSANSAHSRVVSSAQLILKNQGLSKETPAILSVYGTSLEKLGKLEMSQDTFEKLAYMLPFKSLFRSQFHHDLEKIREMEEFAEKAAIKMSTFHYQNGLVSGNAESFKRAESFFQILANFKPTDPRTSEWKLKIAHCQFFQKNFDQAYEKYKSSIEATELDQDQLKLAIYQSAVTSESAWREAYRKAVSHGASPHESQEVLKFAKRLEESVNHYSERFPQDTRSVDLLLVSASAYRDMELYDKAENLWRRILVLSSTPNQRALAIRGTIYSKIKNGTPRDVIESSFNFIQLENWKKMDSGLWIELNSVLSTALFKEAERLKSQGLMADAGQVLTDFGAVAKDLPERGRILRDGAYFFAIAGQWLKAEKSSREYLKSGEKSFKSDMQYLLARSTEYQLKVGEAALAYFALAREDPSYSKSKIALDRAENLATAEGMSDLSESILNLRLERSKSRSEKLNYIDQIMTIQKNSNRINEAEKLGRLRLRLSESSQEKIQSRLALAELNYLSSTGGARQDVLDELKILDRQIQSNRGNFSPEQFAENMGKTNFLRGKVYKDRFDAVNLQNSSNPQNATRLKSSHFASFSEFYERVMAFGTKDQVIQARFELAQTAETLASELTGLEMSQQSASSLNLRSRNRETIQRLQKFAQSLYAKNALLERDEKSVSEWIRKSKARLRQDLSEPSESEYSPLSPISSYRGMLSQWN